MSSSSLGRGLGALIPNKKTLTEQILPEAKGRVIDVPLSSIAVNPHQPRTHFAPQDMEDLIASVKEHGILQPLIVTKKGNEYELIAGERRLRAARTLGLATVPALVREAGAQQKLELALIENVQRQDLNPAEEAIAYRALIDEFNLSVEAVGKRVGKSASVVSNMVRLLDLPEEMFGALREGKITKSHARTLLGEADPKKRAELFSALLSGGLTVRELEAKTSGLYLKRKSAGASKDANILAHEKKLREILGTKVQIQEQGGKGKIVIEFYSREDLVGLLDALSG